MDEHLLIPFPENEQHRMLRICNQWEAFKISWQFVRNYLYKTIKWARYVRQVFVTWYLICRCSQQSLKISTFQCFNDAHIHSTKYSLFLSGSKSHAPLLFEHLNLTLQNVHHLTPVQNTLTCASCLFCSHLFPQKLSVMRYYTGVFSPSLLHDVTVFKLCRVVFMLKLSQ